MEQSSPTSETTVYSEVVRPPVWLLTFILFLTESIALSLWAAFDNRVGAFAFFAALFIMIVAALSMTMKIEVTHESLIVDRAHIERRYLGDVIALDAKEMARVRGRDADPAAYLALRFWQPKGIQIFLNDDRDPTPYWLITSKRPNDLVAALQKN